MKRLLIIGLISALFFCSCGNNNTLIDNSASPLSDGDNALDNNVSPLPDIDSTLTNTDSYLPEKGSISNPYKKTDIVEIIAYEIQKFDYVTGKREVGNPATFQFSNFEYSKCTEQFTVLTEEEQRGWFITLHVDVVEHENGKFEYVSDPNKCIGCGICAGLCPCGIWEMEENN